MSARKSNWPRLLGLFVEEKRAEPFDWRTNNCSFFAADWLAILTGDDPAAKYRDQVDSALSAARVLNAAGGIEHIAEREFAERWWPEINPKLAQRGDVALCPTPDGPALGVVLGASVLFAGNVTQPLAACVRAWRIE